eukprot:CAMPEP_0204156608 /NCGR_PEP_ID=MMETSP0361-20130328/30572_1 /ASSEMBLY_ACC=CAM_ASM_000343 /TAXON_ID=268821 /ORGANISM="Scrippsiella Hangoei, Strain SHTV-5" /LENGTH=55 /DNA_ID=CAMNT_0051112263 /DNA_START=131 /DNA_END=295 /DNA_ORIENTATION=+
MAAVSKTICAFLDISSASAMDISPSLLAAPAPAPRLLERSRHGEGAETTGERLAC